MSLKIAYTFVANDRFTQKLKHINQQVNRFRKNMAKAQKSTQNVDKSQEKFSKSTATLSKRTDDLVKKINRLSKAKGKDEDNTKSWTQTLVRATSKFTNFSQKIAKLSDKFGMGAYFRLMNIAIPMGIIAKLGTDYADSLVRSNSIMNNLWGTSKKNVSTLKQLGKEANTLSLTMPYTKSALLGSATTAAMATGDIRDAKTLMPDIAKFATFFNMPLAQATQTVIAKMANSATTFQPGLGRFQGSTQNKIRTLTQRLNQPAYVKTVKEIISGSPGIQLKIMLNQFQAISGVIMKGILPALQKINFYLLKIKPDITAWVTKHKELFKIIGFTAIAALGFLATLSAIGAIIGTLAMPFELLAVILKMVGLLSKANMELRGIPLAFKGITALAALMNVPILIMVGAIAAIGVAVYEIYKHWDAIEKKIISVYHLLSHDIAHPSAGIHDIGHALSTPSAAFTPGLPTLFGGKNEINVHIHDKGNHVSHVESKGDSSVKTTLSQTYPQHQLGLNMATY